MTTRGWTERGLELTEHLCQFIGFEGESDRWCMPFTDSEKYACGRPAKFHWYYHTEECKGDAACCIPPENEYWVCADCWDALVIRLENYELG
jgi:hypothetical protein